MKACTYARQAPPDGEALRRCLALLEAARVPIEAMGLGLEAGRPAVVRRAGREERP